MRKISRVLAVLLSAALAYGTFPAEALAALEKGLAPGAMTGRSVEHTAALPQYRFTPRAGAYAFSAQKDFKTTPPLSGYIPAGERPALEVPAERPSERQDQAIDAARQAAANEGQRSPNQSAEQARSNAAGPFEKTAPNASEPVAAKASLSTRLLNRLSASRVGRYVPSSVMAGLHAAAKADLKLFPTDEYGGPRRQKLNWSGQILYGARSGLNLIGVETVIKAVSRLFSHVSWQLKVSPAVLHGLGRIELLTRFGRPQIAQALSAHPVHFLAGQLAIESLREEVIYRLANFKALGLILLNLKSLSLMQASSLAMKSLGFGGLWIVLASLKPASAALAKRLNSLPDIFAVRWMAQKALGLAGKVSEKAFPIAALISSWRFAAAHFALWGVSPSVAATQGILGFGLAYIAYRSRSLFSSAAAHYVFNFLTLFGNLFLIYHMPAAFKFYAPLLSVASLVSLYYTLRSYAKEHHQAVAASVKKVATLLVGAVLAGSAISAATHRQAAVPAEPPAAVAAAKPQAEAADKKAPAPKPRPQAAAKALASEELTAKAMPSVVMVRFEEGLGTGFIVSSDGLVVTNAHVARLAGPSGLAGIIFDDGKTMMGKVVAINTDRDLAIIQLPPNPDGWTPLPLSDNSDTARGQKVWALGHPEGFSFSVSQGIVSGVGGQERTNFYVDYIQTDAAVNPGNSGGPLLNERGEVIGVNSWGATEHSAGLNFAITAKDVQLALKQYAETGDINSSWLGIIVDGTNPAPPDQGIVIEQVRPGSPAGRAGLAPGDAIVGIEGKALPASPQESIYALAQVLAQSRPGRTLRLNFAHAGRLGVAKLVLGDKK